MMMGFKELFNKKKNEGGGGEGAGAAEEILSYSSRSASNLSSRSRSRSRAQMEKELEQVFKKLDVDGDGKISPSELAASMMTGQAAAEDWDKDGLIDLHKFIELNTKDIDYEEAVENLKDAFGVFDVDKNGTISAEELRDVLVSLGEECTLAESRKMISGVDVDGDGAISFEEFKLMMMMGSRFHDMNM